MFTKIEGDQALLVIKGQYKEADLYEFQGGLFAKYNGGYVRLKVNGSTSKQGVDFCHLETEARLWSDQFGRIAVVERDKYKAITIDIKDDGLVRLIEQ